MKAVFRFNCFFAIWSPRNVKILCVLLVSTQLLSLILSFIKNQQPKVDYVQQNDAQIIDAVRNASKNESYLKDNKLFSTQRAAETSTLRTLSSITLSTTFVTHNFHTLKAGSSGLGNRMYEVASLYGIAAKLNMLPYIPQQLNRSVADFQQYFPAFQPLLQVKVENNTAVKFATKFCSYENVDLLRNVSHINLTIGGSYFQSYLYFDHIQDRLKSELFKFSDDVLQMAKTVIANVTEQFCLSTNPKIILNTTAQETASSCTIFRTCVHTRRGDFVRHPFLLGSTELFTANAVNFLRNTTLLSADERHLFLILGDDRNWTESVFQNRNKRTESDVFIPPSPSAKTVDMAILATHCDQILLTASWSTYGFWGAYLASNRTKVFYNQDYSKDYNYWWTKQFTPSDVFLPQWTPINVTSIT